MRREARESQIETDRKNMRDGQAASKRRARFCNHTFSKCTTKELSHCYVKPNVTFMRAPSSRSRPVGMAHKRPIWFGWLLGHYLKLISSKQEHLERFSAAAERLIDVWHHLYWNEWEGSYVARGTRGVSKPWKKKR